MDVTSTGNGAAAHGPPTSRTHQPHCGEAVRVGPYAVHAWGTQYKEPVALIRSVDLIVPLTREEMPFDFGYRYSVLCGALPDMKGVPENWEEFIREAIEELKNGKKMLAYCVGSHGRTGVFLASLIALLESPEETPDPIKAVRERHCEKAVETYAQAEAIFRLRGQKLPKRYRREFTPRPATVATVVVDQASAPQPSQPAVKAN